MTQRQRIVRILVPGFLGTFIVAAAAALWEDLRESPLLMIFGVGPLAYAYWLLDLHQEQHGKDPKRPVPVAANLGPFEDDPVSDLT